MMYLTASAVPKRHKPVNLKLLFKPAGAHMLLEKRWKNEVLVPVHT